ncbi:MAG: SIMPL domain-containing protein [Patescibacteria group bacterium]
MENFKSPKAIIALLALIAITAVVIISILRDRIVNQQPWQVAVVGQGKVAYQPDIADVTLGVQIDKVAKAENALNQLNDKVNKIIAAVKAAGIPPEDIQTQNYSLYPQYDSPDNVMSLSGYNANQQLLIKVRGIDKEPERVSKVVAEATKAGVNQVVGVSFDVSNLEELKQQARIKAIGDAQIKASSLAAAARVRLGKVIGWWENIIQAPGIGNAYYGDKGGMGGGLGTGATSSLPTGSQEVILEINLNYQVR